MAWIVCQPGRVLVKRVVEEVGLRSDATDRVETIHDTARQEEVEIEQIPAETTPTAAPEI